MKRLTEKQEAFCEEYIHNGYIGGEAYQKAFGVETKTVANSAACALLRMPKIIDRLRLVEGDYRLIGHKIGLDKKKILERLSELLSAKKEVITKDGVVILVNDNAAANKAAETILKLYGDFSPEKRDINLHDDNNDVVDISKLTPEQRKELKEATLKALSENSSIGK